MNMPPKESPTQESLPSIHFGSLECMPFSVLSGQDNMNADEEMANKTSKDDVTRFRLYTWKPWAVSGGFNQKTDTFNTQEIEKRGYHFVRRPTGGRGVFHSQELTYCITTPSEGSQHNRDIYKFIHQLIAEAFSNLGVHTDYEKSNSSFREHYETAASGSCFTSSARYELTLNGKKLVGSAQRDYGGTLLQHGSILLGPAHLEMADLIKSETEESKSRLRNIISSSSTDVYTATGKEIQPIDLANEIYRLLQLISIKKN